MERRKLVILTQYFPPEMGAPQSRLFETASGLVKLGWQVEVITAMPNYPTGRIFPKYRNRFCLKENWEEIPVRRYWLYASNSKSALPRIINMISFSLTALRAVFYLRKWRPNYLLVESPPLLLGLSGLFLTRACRARFILNVSDIWPLSASELGAIQKGGIVYRLLERLEHFLYRQAYACTCQSQEITDHVGAQGAKRAWLFRNGVDIKRFHVQETKSYDRPLRIVYGGLLGVAQGILKLCENLDLECKSIEFHIYGTGAERKAIEAYLLESAKSGIFLHDPVSRNEVPGMLALYDLTLIPLIKPIYGAVPSKIYEAMAAGLPILFAGGGEGAIIVEKHNVGWICTPSEYQYMNQLLSDISRLSDQDLDEMRKNCLSAAKIFFNRDTQIQNLNTKLLKH